MMQSISSSIHVSLHMSDRTWDDHTQSTEMIKSISSPNVSSKYDGFLTRSSRVVVKRCQQNTSKSVHELAANVAAEAMECFKKDLPDSLLRELENRDCIAPFGKHELQLGRLLGSGEFSNVFEIKSFIPDASIDRSAGNDETCTRHLMKAREQYRDSKKARYAMKQLRPDLHLKYSQAEYAEYARDIVMEAQFLSILQHPNIIKIRGISVQGLAGLAEGPKGFFLVIDKLDETLDDRIKSWRNHGLKIKKSKFEILQRSTSKVISKKKVEDDCKDEPSLLTQQLEIALQIAAALKYLHEKRIIFRDLKPENLGFDVRGDIKLFDFGLSKVIPSGIDPYEGMHKMSLAGTPRYMASEVLSGKPYNLKSDVYTFGIVIWELLSLQRPFVGIRNKNALIRHIVCEGGRPVIEDEWRTSIKELLVLCFGASNERPNMAHIFEVIRRETAEISKGGVSKYRESYLLRRRTIASTRHLADVVRAVRRSPRVRLAELRYSLTSSLSKFGQKSNF